MKTAYVSRMKRPAKTLPTNSNGTENNEAVVIESNAVDKKKPIIDVQQLMIHRKPFFHIRKRTVAYRRRTR